MAIVCFPASYQTPTDILEKLVVESPLNGKQKNEVLWSFDAIQIFQEWFTAHYGELKEIKHRSNPDDPPDLELIFERGHTGFEHTSLKPYPLGHAEAIAQEVNPGGGRILPTLSHSWSREELQTLALSRGGKWGKCSDEHRVAFESLVAALRRKMKDPVSEVICVRDQATISWQGAQWLASDLWKVVNDEEFQDFGDRRVILCSPMASQGRFSALLRRGEALRAFSDGVITLPLRPLSFLDHQ